MEFPKEMVDPDIASKYADAPIGTPVRKIEEAAKKKPKVIKLADAGHVPEPKRETFWNRFDSASVSGWVIGFAAGAIVGISLFYYGMIWAANEPIDRNTIEQHKTE